MTAEQVRKGVACSDSPTRTPVGYLVQPAFLRNGKQMEKGTAMFLDEKEFSLAGVIVNAELDFQFEVWADKKMSDQDFQSAYHAFLARNNTPAQRESLRGVVIRQHRGLRTFPLPEGNDHLSL
jgi:hypothetical protein